MSVLEESLTTNNTPGLCPRIRFYNGLGLLEEMLHEECLLTEASQSQHSSSATLPERKTSKTFIQTKRKLLKYLKSTYGSHVGVRENQDLKMLQSQQWFHLSIAFHEKQLIYSGHGGHTDFTQHTSERHNYFSFGKH